MPQRVYLPPGPLRRFRLPRGSGLPVERPSRAVPILVWALLPFIAFGGIAYGLRTGVTASRVASWFEVDTRQRAGLPIAQPTAVGPGGPVQAPISPGQPPQQEPASAPPASPRTDPTAPGAAASGAVTAGAPASGASTPRRAGSRNQPRASRKPALVLNRHRLRPITEWKRAERESAERAPGSP